MLEGLIEAGHDPNIAGPEDQRPLNIAALNSDVAKLDLLLEHGADINQVNQKGYHAMHSACEAGALATVQRLANSEFSFLNSAEMKLPVGGMEKSLSGLHLAAINGHDHVVGFLLNGKMTSFIDTLTDAGWSALHLSIVYGHPTTTRLLLDAGADSSIIVEPSKDTCLHIAVQCTGADIAIVKILLEHGCDPTAVNREGLVPDMVAEAQGFQHGRELLKDAAVKKCKQPLLMTHKSQEGQTTTAWTQEMLKMTFSQRTISHNWCLAVDFYIRQVDGGKWLNSGTALRIAYTLEEDASTVELLLDLGAEPDARTDLLATPLTITASFECQTALEVLIKAGAQVDALQIDQPMALHISAS